MQFARPGISKCTWCGLPLHYDSARGWVHPKGAAYVMECAKCGWVGEQPAFPLTADKDVCPSCGNKRGLRDHHVANPK